MGWFITGFVLVVAAIGLIACWADHMDTLGAQVRNTEKGHNLEYVVQYNIRKKKYYIVARSSRGSYPMHRAWGPIIYFDTSTRATLEIEKLRGNFE